MKLITFASLKGGAGKTTALMAVCSSLAAQGRKVALLEADPNTPLENWRDEARDFQTWDENCAIFPADTPLNLDASFGKAEAGGYEIALVDTQGGGSELNNSILVNSHVVIVPSALSPLDLDAAVDTIEYAAQLFIEEKLEIPMALLLQRIPVGRMTKSMMADMLVLDSLPQFETRLHERDAFRSIKSRGMLHMLYARLAADPMHRIGAGHIRKAMDEADAFTNELMDAINMVPADVHKTA